MTTDFMKKIDTSILFKEVSASSLGIMRFLFGLILLEDLVNFHNYFKYSLSASEFYNTYEFFHWVHLMPTQWMDVFFYGAGGVCILFALGIQYRLNAVLLFLSWTYIFLVDKGHYNNHFYLVAILLFFFSIVGADRWGAVTKTEKNTVPYWQVLIFRWQLAIVYFYGGIAKLHMDWIEGFPMRYWLEAMSYKYPEAIQAFIKTDAMALLFSWGGLAFDLIIPLLLLSKKWRYWAILPVAAFHTLNDYTWDIGDFPTIMLAITPIFFATNWAEHFYQQFSKYKTLVAGVAIGFLVAGLYGYFIMDDTFYATNAYIKYCSYPVLLFLFLNRNKEKGIISATVTTTYFVQKRSSLVLLTIWFSFQLLFPFRHWLYAGHPSWTGEGHLFAWRMMLVDTVDAWRMQLIVPETGEVLPVALNQYVNYRQYRKMRRTPKSFVRFAHFIRDKAEESGVKNPIIKMEVWKSVNNRSPKLVNDTTLNYAVVPCIDAVHASWITDWQEADEKPNYYSDKYARWQDFLKEEGNKPTVADWR